MILKNLLFFVKINYKKIINLFEYYEILYKLRFLYCPTNKIFLFSI